MESGSIQPIEKARVLAFLADSVTTDHISPAGSIAKILRREGISWKKG